MKAAELSLIELTVLLQLDAMLHGCTDHAGGLSWTIEQGYAEYLGGDNPMESHVFTDKGVERAHVILHNLDDVMYRVAEMRRQ